MTSEKESITQDLIPNLIKSRVGGAQKLRRTKLIRIVGVGLLVSRAAYDLIFSVLFFFFFFLSANGDKKLERTDRKRQVQGSGSSISGNWFHAPWFTTEPTQNLAFGVKIQRIQPHRSFYLNMCYPFCSPKMGLEGNFHLYVCRKICDFCDLIDL